jgi:hypothetical protein
MQMMNSAMRQSLATGLILVLVACSNSSDNNSVAAQKAMKIVPASAKISSSISTSLPDFAFDGNVSTVWNAGAFAPGWIQLDLGQVLSISRVRLNPAQFPSGPTTHEISAGPTPDSLNLIGTLDGVTSDGQWLEFNKSVSNVRYVRISTSKSPSWVSWREIEFYK